MAIKDILEMLDLFYANKHLTEKIKSRERSREMTKEEAINYGRGWYKEIESRGDSANSDALTFLSWAILSLFDNKKTGRWLDKDRNTASRGTDCCSSVSCWCSECGDWLTASDEYSCRGNYCPNCGAEMYWKEDIEEDIEGEQSNGVN